MRIVCCPHVLVVLVVVGKVIVVAYSDVGFPETSLAAERVGNGGILSLLGGGSGIGEAVSSGSMGVVGGRLLLQSSCRVGGNEQAEVDQVAES